MVIPNGMSVRPASPTAALEVLPAYEASVYIDISQRF